MADKKVIAVVGATGAQGGGLARAILADPGGGFAVRALTRDRRTPTARRRSRGSGPRSCRADIDDEASLTQAFEGAYGAFCVTFFWAHFSAEKEIAQARQHGAGGQGAGRRSTSIWSTLEDTRKLVPLDDDRMPTLQGKYKVPHFDAKGEANHLFTDAGVPTTFLLTSFYWENFIYFGIGPAARRGRHARDHVPDGRQEAAGHRRRGHRQVRLRRSSRRGGEFIGKTVGIAGEHLTGAQMAAALTKALGRGGALQRRAARRLPRASASPAPTTSATCSSSSATSRRTTAARATSTLARALNPELQTFDDWLAANASRIPLG